MGGRIAGINLDVVACELPLSAKLADAKIERLPALSLAERPAVAILRFGEGGSGINRELLHAAVWRPVGLCEERPIERGRAAASLGEPIERQARPVPATCRERFGNLELKRRRRRVGLCGGNGKLDVLASRLPVNRVTATLLEFARHDATTRYPAGEVHGIGERRPRFPCAEPFGMTDVRTHRERWSRKSGYEFVLPRIERDFTNRQLRLHHVHPHAIIDYRLAVDGGKVRAVPLNFNQWRVW